jgi:tetratricopeptide (TPR) repeat protein
MLLLHSCIDFDAAVAGIFLVLCAAASAAVCRARGLTVRGKMQVVLVCVSIPCVFFMYAVWGLKNIECRTMESGIEKIMESREADPERALEICEKGRRLFPRHHRFYALEVEICRRLGYGYEERMTSVQRQLARLYRVKAAEWSRLGLMYETQGKWKQAVRFHTISTDLYPNNPRYLGILSRSLYRAGQKKESRETARESLALDRTAADPNVRLTSEERSFLEQLLR